ncbi:SdiA-regulated domain-containing protein [Aquimarina sp. ERC-38]|uniref:SdiA-regulated domain-containing protein n=1 Tax=Aquimarina sp. ERC-38 TaxID=2949996 RepID=UPI002245CEEC|nr:SdiA-regulated domain-containing protein [Aquimarina sp. ERC-38]UZO79868.1 SdiA-regulated domain-containing protein [Aquimarina sp. ERC-38]
MIYLNKNKYLYFVWILFALLYLPVSCQNIKDKDFTIVHSLSPLLKEVSGITYDPENRLLFAVNDSGNDNNIFALNTKGQIINQYTVKGVYNKDWEAISLDSQNNLYIGDFGNNKNERKDLKIYKISSISSAKPVVKTISFTLSDQKAFPPKKKGRNFDIEAFIIMKDHIFLFSRNRGSDFNGNTKIYQLLNQPGTQTAELITTLFIGNDDKDCFITDAAINSKGNKIVLLTYNKVMILDSFKKDSFWDGTLSKIKLNHSSQKEGITFLNDSTLLITDEKKKSNGNYLYKYQLD